MLAIESAVVVGGLINACHAGFAQPGQLERELRQILTAHHRLCPRTVRHDLDCSAFAFSLPPNLVDVGLAAFVPRVPIPAFTPAEAPDILAVVELELVRRTLNK